MTNEERMLAQIAATQALAVATTGLLFAMSGNDPDLSKAKAILAVLQADSERGLGDLPPAVQAEARAILSDLCNRVIEGASGHRAPNQTRQ